MCLVPFTETGVQENWVAGGREYVERTFAAWTCMIDSEHLSSTNHENSHAYWHQECWRLAHLLRLQLPSSFVFSTARSELSLQSMTAIAECWTSGVKGQSRTATTMRQSLSYWAILEQLCPSNGKCWRCCLRSTRAMSCSSERKLSHDLGLEILNSPTFCRPNTCCCSTCTLGNDKISQTICLFYM